MINLKDYIFYDNNIQESLNDDIKKNKKINGKPLKKPNIYTTRYANKQKIKIEDLNNNADINDIYTEVFIIIKPGFNKLSHNIINMFLKNDFECVKMKSTILTKQQAGHIYDMHKDKDFYLPLCKYMSSDISTGIIFKIRKNKKEAFKLLLNIKDNIRKNWSESDMRNVIHSSDSVENIYKESFYYF